MDKEDLIFLATCIITAPYSGSGEPINDAEADESLRQRFMNWHSFLSARYNDCHDDSQK